MNVRPKTNSFGGSNVFGVLLCTIVSFEGSISCTLIPDAASAFTLYDLVGGAHAAISLEVDCLKALCGRN